MAHDAGNSNIHLMFSTAANQQGLCRKRGASRSKALWSLIFAILVSLLLGVFAGFFTYKAQQHIKLAEQVSDQLKARMLADSALQRGIYGMSNLRFDGVDWPGTDQKFATKLWGEN